MFDYIKGVITANRSTVLVVENQGIGYQLRCSLRTASELGVGVEAQVFTYQHITQDQTQLFGFATPDERAFFLQIISISGIGPKVALAVLSAMTENELLRSVQLGDEDQFTAVPGVGKMTAKRLLLELSKKLPQIDSSGAEEEDLSNLSAALQALEALGFKRSKVEPLVRRQLNDDRDMSVEDILRGVLKQHGRK
jgi:holliday junction DNA helicase RuvA